MATIANLSIGIVALLHGYFMVLEMFFWNKPLGLKTFGNTREKAELTKVLAANQGLYNGFLSAGLIWGLLKGVEGYDFKVFFLLCVIAAGVFGSLTASKKIIFVQAIPGAIGLALIFFSA